MAGKTFRLTSDMQFVHTNTKEERTYKGRIVVLYVSEYKGTPKSITEAGDDAWLGGVARVTNDKDQLDQGLATNDAIEVNGATIKGELLTELFNDLAMERETDTTQKTFLMFNRQGQFLVNVGGAKVKKILPARGVLRNGSWSKYGVKVAAGDDEEVTEKGNGNEPWKEVMEKMKEIELLLKKSLEIRE